VYSSGGVFKLGSEWGCWGWQERQSWQWQPALDSHDPNPPIPLEDGAPAGVTGTLAGSVSITGAASAAHGVSGTLAGSISTTASVAAYFGATTTCLDAVWGSDVNSGGTKGHLDGDDFAGITGAGVTWRWSQKFNVSGISGTIVGARLSVNVTLVPGVSTHDIGPYGTAGTDDPQTDAGATMFSRCSNTGQYANDTSALAATGVRTVVLGSQAVTDLQAALSGGAFSISCRLSAESGTDIGSVMEEYSGGSSPPELCVTFLADGSVTGTIAGTITPTASITAFRGVSGTLAGSFAPTASISATRGVAGTLAGSFAPVAAIAALRGVSSTLAGSVAPTSSITAFRGESATLAGSVVPVGAFSGTHTAPGVAGSITAAISLVGDIRGKFQSSRAAAVKHYSADPSEPDVPRTTKPRKRRRVEPEQPVRGASWEMPLRRVDPPPPFNLSLPELPPFIAPVIRPPEPVALAPEPEPELPPEPPAPRDLRIEAAVSLSAKVEVLSVSREYLEQARFEDRLLLSRLGVM
jgi:hypothetical protein